MNNKERGCITNRERAKQLTNFSGCIKGKKSGTDIDFFMEQGGKVFLFGEMKLEGSDTPPLGQRIAFRALAEAIMCSGSSVVVAYAEHGVFPPEEDIFVHKATVFSSLDWHPGLQKVIQWEDGSVATPSRALREGHYIGQTIEDICNSLFDD